MDTEKNAVDDSNKDMIILEMIDKEMKNIKKEFAELIELAKASIFETNKSQHGMLRTEHAQQETKIHNNCVRRSQRVSTDISLFSKINRKIYVNEVVVDAAESPAEMNNNLMERNTSEEKKRLEKAIAQIFHDEIACEKPKKYNPFLMDSNISGNLRGYVDDGFDDAAETSPLMREMESETLEENKTTLAKMFNSEEQGKKKTMKNFFMKLKVFKTKSTQPATTERNLRGYVNEGFDDSADLSLSKSSDSMEPDSLEENTSSHKVPAKKFSTGKKCGITKGFYLNPKITKDKSKQSTSAVSDLDLEDSSTNLNKLSLKTYGNPSQYTLHNIPEMDEVIPYFEDIDITGFISD